MFYRIGFGFRLNPIDPTLSVVFFAVTEVLATLHSDVTGKDEPVIWTNKYQGVRVFGILLGNHNEKIESEQRIVAAGWNWSLAR